MSFKFTFFGIESTAKSNNGSNSSDVKIKEVNEKMAKKSTRKKKLNGQQKKFSIAAKKCHKDTKSPSAFGSCMSRELKSKKSKRKK